MLQDTKCQNIVIPTLENILEDSVILFVKSSQQQYICWKTLRAIIVLENYLATIPFWDQKNSIPDMEHGFLTNFCFVLKSA
jgi:hypothetical protein